MSAPVPDQDRKVAIYDPRLGLDDPPVYEGPASQTHRQLNNGVYRAVDTSNGTEVYVLVDLGQSRLYLNEPPDYTKPQPQPVAERAAIIVLAGQYLLNHPTASVDDATRIAAAAVDVVQQRATTDDWRQVVDRLSMHGTGDPNFLRPQAPSPADGHPSGPARERDGVRSTVVGNLVADPEGGFNEQGHAYARFTVVSSQRRPGPDGQWSDGPKEYTQVVAFRQRAEEVINVLRKGDAVTVTGRPEVEAFARRDGSPGAAMKVFANAITRREPSGQAPESAVATATTRSGPTVHHNPDHTAVTGVQRSDTELQQTLKSAGFRWSAQRTLWYLPASMPVDEREQRVGQVVSALAEHGVDLRITAEPAVGTTPARHAAAAVGASFTPEPFAPVAVPVGPVRT